MDLKVLLKKYMSGKIKDEDFKLLQSSVRDLFEKDLDSTFEALWAESERRTMDPEKKMEVRATLRRGLCATTKKHL